MESLLYEVLEYGVGALIGCFLGVLALTLLRASDAGEAPTPPAWRSQPVSAWWRKGRAALFDPHRDRN